MANYDAYEEEFGQENPSSLEESLVEALDSNVQLSINQVVAKALGPLTSHLKGFARQQGWLPSIAAPAETPSQPAKPSKAKAKTKKWPHSEAFERLSATVLEEHGYSNSRAQEATSDNSEWAGSDSSQEVSDSDWEDKPGPSKRKRSDHGSSHQAPLKLLTFDPTEIVHPRSTNWTPLSEVASYVQSHLRQSSNLFLALKVLPKFLVLPRKEVNTVEKGPFHLNITQLTDTDDDMEFDDMDDDDTQDFDDLWQGPLEKRSKISLSDSDLSANNNNFTILDGLGEPTF
ncbi:hypothetical protein NDU88_003181 [Pleurodeles waltl]|uniref:Uncharacterized protein n=1 Tax=Pleurodeles waltl TaxID=8319 RepID=A0AAV7MQW5_PLEWA|nr:hypothetical protein NDU88_003181 [Pleurodeles waltl]